MIVKIESKETFEMVCRQLKAGDTLIIPTVKILDSREKQAFEKYMQLFDKGVTIYTAQEPYLQRIINYSNKI